MNNQTTEPENKEKGYPSVEERMEQIAMAIASIHGALKEINENEDYEISEYLDEIEDSLKWIDENCY